MKDTSFQSLHLTNFNGFRSLTLEAEAETGIRSQHSLRKCFQEKPMGDGVNKSRAGEEVNQRGGLR